MWKAAGGRAKALQLRCRPPQPRDAASVVALATVVERMAELVTHERATSAVVRGVVGVGIEDRRLKYRGRCAISLDGVRFWDGFCTEAHR